MSYYDLQSWQSPGRPASWEQPPPPSRSGIPDMITSNGEWKPNKRAGASSAAQRDEPSAFGLQIEEVDRAVDNLVKSGKLFNMPTRRDSLPVTGLPRPYSEYDPRMGGAIQRHHSISEYDPTRSHSASNLQNFYANQRYQPRPNEAEQMMQAKRRMAAQRERELRNYHQEQQYNRSVLADVSNSGRPERSNSPAMMNEEDRRELIARQHRALYGNESSSFFDGANFGDDSHTPRPSVQPTGATSASTAPRGSSPLNFDSYGVTQSSTQIGSSEGQSAVKGPSPRPQQRSRANSTSSPASNTQSFSLFDNAAQQSSRTSTSSPGGSPPRQAKSSNGHMGSTVAPIGTRPVQAQAANPALGKRSTTPLPSPLSYGFAPNERVAANSSMAERSTSAASNPAVTAKDSGMGMNWASGGGVWGKGSLGAQASVWG